LDSFKLCGIIYLCGMFLRGSISTLIPFLLVTGSLAQIQGTDTLYRPSELHYFSAMEKGSFAGYFGGQPDYLRMILSVDAGSREEEAAVYRDWIGDIVREIRYGKFDRLSEVKKINQVRSTVSRTFVVAFRHQSGFSDLFTHGTYNYFTAASLYGFVLDQLGIPYEIREVSTSILLLAYPDSERISIDIEGPGSPFFMFAHDTRENFIEFLRESKTVDDATFASTTSRVLFDRYYFADYGLTIRDMIGMMYLNSAIEYLNRGMPEDAYDQLEKAFILHPSSKSQYLLLAHLNSFLATMDYHNPRGLGYLIKASRLIGFGVGRELILTYLKDIIHDVLIEAQDMEGMKYIYDYLQEYLADAAVKKEFNYLYDYETGRLHYNEERYAKALEFFESAYRLKPGDANVQDALTKALAAYSINTSPGMALEKIDYFDTACTEILSHELYIAVKQQVCLDFFGEAFQLQDGQNGERYMAIFEEITDRYPENKVDYLAVGRSYSSAAIYYYRQGQVQKSKKVLEKGLEYAPHNIELKLKLKSFE
jgi:tetratricopeptide (TPR) repeat protein